jgi:hypothetical protein
MPWSGRLGSAVWCSSGRGAAAVSGPRPRLVSTCSLRPHWRAAVAQWAQPGRRGHWWALAGWWGRCRVVGEAAPGQLGARAARAKCTMGCPGDGASARWPEGRQHGRRSHRLAAGARFPAGHAQPASQLSQLTWLSQALWLLGSVVRRALVPHCPPS